MSNKALTWVWQESESKGSALLVLLALADQADDDGVCFPSVAYIARKCRLQERSAQYALRSLEESREISRVSRRGHSTVYRIALTPESAPQPKDEVHESAPQPKDEVHESAGVSQTTGARNCMDEVHHGAPITLKEPSLESPTPVVGTRERKRSTPTAPRGTRVPEDFEPDERMLEWVRRECPGVPANEHGRFMDHWRSTPGTKGMKLDWIATWRNWMRRAQDDINSGRRPAANGPRRSTTDDRVSAGIALARQLAAEEAAAQQPLQLTTGEAS